MTEGVCDFTIYAGRFEGPRSSAGLLLEAARRYTGDRLLNPALDRKEGGKPFFRDMPELHFSVTHSGEYWMCAFGRAPVGLDLQEHRRCDVKGVARRFFHPEEAEFLLNRDFCGFFSVWAAKESYLKFTGLGISGGLSRFSAVGAGGITGEKLGLRIREIDFLPGYSLCICARELGDVAVLHMT